VGMVSGSVVDVNMSKAVRISASWEGVRPGATALLDFRRLAGGYMSAHLTSTGGTMVDDQQTKFW